MRKLIRFYSFLSFIPLFSFKISTMNSLTRRCWQLPALAILFVGLFAGSGKAQTCSIGATANPLELELTINQTTGTATLTSADIIGFYTTDCGLPIPMQLPFFTDATLTTFFGSYSTACLGSGSTVVFDCDDVNQTISFYVAFHDGQTNLNPFNCEFDASSLSEGAEVRVTIRDKTGPQAAAPANITVSAEAGVCTASAATIGTMLEMNDVAVGAYAGAAGTYTDNCLSNLSISYELTGATTVASTPGNDAGGETFNVGVTTVTYTITDQEYTPGVDANPITVACTVTVEDNQMPMITCPADFTVNADATCMAQVGVTANASDNCAMPPAISWQTTGSPINGATANLTLPLGMTTITFTADDGNGNTNTCSTVVTVEDNTAPMITCPADMTVNADVNCEYVVAGTGFDATSSDNCGVASTLHDQVPPSNTLNGYTFAQGTTTVEWEVTDNAGLTASCTHSVTVVDVTPPTVSLNAVYNADVTPGDCSKVITVDMPEDGTPAATDNCTPPASIVLQLDSVIVNGTSTPGFFSGSGWAPNNGGPLTWQFPAGTTVVYFSWTDLEGNFTVGTITVNIDEDEDPVAVCKPLNTLVLAIDATASVSFIPSFVDNGSSDNCPDLMLSTSPASFACADLGLQVVTLTATDAAGNTATCTTNVNVVDNIAPDVLCPASFTVTANSGCNATGVTGGNLTAGTFGSLGTGEYADNCSVTEITWALSGATTGNSPATGINTDLSGVSFNPGSTTVTYTVKDGSGNQKACNFAIVVSDLTGPLFDDSPANVPDAGTTITLNSNLAGCQAQYTFGMTLLFLTPVQTHLSILSQTHFSGAFFPFGETTVTYLAQDAAGNISTYTFKVNVVDNQAPNPICQDITVSLDGSGQATVDPDDIDNGSTDNCFFNYVSTSVTYDCDDLGDNTYILNLVDGSGNTASCSATVTVEDNIAPTAICTAVGMINLDANGDASLSAGALNNNSTDNCPLGLTYEISLNGGSYGSSVDFDCSLLGMQTVTLQVTDEDENTDTCSEVVTIKDVTAPTFTGPVDVTVSCDDSTDPADTGVPTNIDDACDDDPVVGSAQTFLLGPCDNSFTIQRVWTVTDDSGNSSVYTQFITIVDNEDPEFDIESAITIETDDPEFCDAPLTLEITADSLSDNCSTFANLTVSYTIDYPTPSYGYVDVASPVIGTSIPSSAWPIGATVVTWFAEDQCGNSTSQMVTITVLDTQAPVFTNGYENICGEEYVLINTTGNCSNLFTWQRPSDLFDHVFDCQDFTVTEQFDNATVQQAITQSNPYDYNAGLSFQVFPSAQFPVGTTTVTYTAEDVDGNTSTCTFTVEVEDTEAPVLTCPPDQVLSATCPDAQIQDYRNLVNVSDNCPSDVLLTQVWAPGTTLGDIFAPDPPAADSMFTITITGEDQYNMGTCTFKVTLEDGDAPIPSVAQLPDIVDSCGFYIVFAPTATDACNPSAPIIYGTPSAPVGQFLPGTPPRYKLLPGNYVITWVYNDGNGNVSSQPQNITVLPDTFPPVALCKPGFTINLSGVTGEAGINVGQINNNSFDMNDCGMITLGISQDSFDCDDLGVNVVTLTVTDTSGNTATCSTNVTVRDVTAPVFVSVPPNVQVEACDTLPDFTMPDIQDLCDSNLDVIVDTVSTRDTSGFAFYNYTITLTYTATDDSGNSSSATRVITVADTQAPVFSPDAPDSICVFTDPNAQVCSDTAFLDLTSFISDCATGDDLALTNTAFPLGGADATGVYSLGIHEVYFIAEDISGNISVDTVIVEIKDGTSPVAVCINGVSAALQTSGSVTVGYQQFNNNSFDNCTMEDDLDITIQRLDLDSLLAPSTTITFDCDDADGVTEHPVKLFVFDEAGNMSMCETYIVIQDNVFPTITNCPADVVIQCDDDRTPDALGMATATDNCTVDTITYEDNYTAGMDTICEVLTRTWQVFDQADNLTTCDQVIYIQDTIAPAFSQLPPDDTISCSEVLGAPLVLTATDNCTMDVPVTFVQDTIDIAAGLCGKYNYTVRRTWTATDDCDNSTTHSRNITVTDTEAPQFLGMPDTVTVFSANFPPTTDCTVPVDIDVSQYMSDCAPVDELVVLNDAPLGNDSLIVMGDYTVGEYVIHFTATDPCGNTGMDSIVLIVVDNSVPTAICNGDVVIALGTNGTAELMPSDVDLGSTDNCMIDTMFLSQSMFDCGELGPNSVTLTVVDQAGNSNTCTVDVEVELGPTAGFNLALTGMDATTFGGTDGSASADVTGGSGNFSYEWSNGGMGSDINNIPAGIYTVTVTDEDTGCERIDSIEIIDGAKLKLTIGMASGSQGQLVSVPVTVENFIQIYGFSFSSVVELASVGTIVGISNIDANISGLLVNNVNNDTLSVLYADPNQNTLSLPNGTVLFNIDILLDAGAPVGSMSDVLLIDAPVTIEFFQDQNGLPALIMIDTMLGKVTIDNVSNDIVLAGEITTWLNPEVAGSMEEPVANVDVELSGGAAANFLTDMTGQYDFMVTSGINTETSCSKVTVGNAGITAGDLLRIVNHIFGDTFPSPYQWVAADVNNSQTITLADYLLIQRVVLGTDSMLQTTDPWKFVDKDYVFPANNTPMFGPLTDPIPETIEHTPVTMAHLDDDFVAVRMGDVNGNSPVDINSDANDRYGNSEVLYFNLKDVEVEAGQTLTIPFKANKFIEQKAYQFTLVFDPEVLELSGIETGALPRLEESNFGTANLESGYLTTVWVSHDAVSLEDGTTLFTLEFRAKGNSSALSNVLSAGSQITRAEAYTPDGSTVKVDLRYEQEGLIPSNDEFALYQNMPNPFHDRTIISFRLPKAEEATLRVFNISGRMVKMIEGDFMKGYNQIFLNGSDFGAPGVYWYELETEQHSDRKKMILID